VARLDQAAFRLPNPGLLARPAIRQGAVSTSALEGTYAALDDVLEADFLNRDQLTASVAEVHNYVEAAELAFEWIKDKPITVGMLERLQKRGGGRLRCREGLRQTTSSPRSPRSDDEGERRDRRDDAVRAARVDADPVVAGTWRDGDEGGAGVADRDGLLWAP